MNSLDKSLAKTAGIITLAIFLCTGLTYFVGISMGYNSGKRDAYDSILNGECGINRTSGDIDCIEHILSVEQACIRCAGKEQ